MGLPCFVKDLQSGMYALRKAGVNITGFSLERLVFGSPTKVGAPGRSGKHVKWSTLSIDYVNTYGGLPG